MLVHHLPELKRTGVDGIFLLSGLFNECFCFAAFYFTKRKLTVQEVTDKLLVRLPVIHNRYIALTGTLCSNTEKAHPRRISGHKICWMGRGFPERNAAIARERSRMKNSSGQDLLRYPFFIRCAG